MNIISSVRPIQAFEVSANISTEGGTNLLKEAAESFVSLAEKAEEAQAKVMNDVKMNPGNPATLLELQRKMQEHGIQVSTLNAIVHKFATTIDTLTRA